MSDVLQRWNALPFAEAEREILPCCGSHAWARGLVALRPIPDEAALLVASDETWKNLSAADWSEAFDSHPRIGESRPASASGERPAEWSAQEQGAVATADNAAKSALAEANREYERRFHRIFIVCATGKTAPEILRIVRQRMQNDDATEMRVAAEEQRQITQIRLRKWLAT